MRTFDIVADSAVNLPDSYRTERDICVVPFQYLANGEEHDCLEDGVPFRESARKFYDLLKSGVDIKTSLVSEERFIEAALPSLNAGKDVLFLTIASGISGTFQQAKNAAKTLAEQFPNRTVLAADSANASMGEGLLALKAADMRDEGKSCKETYDWLVENAYKLNSYLTVNDLNYLRKSGRISTVLAIAGNLLSIKPIIKADGGEIPKLAVCGKEHGRKKSLSALVRHFKENVIAPEEQTIAVTHADCEEEAIALANEIRELGVKDVIIEYYDLCTGGHVGPGTIALFFMGKDRRETGKPPETSEARRFFARKKSPDSAE